MKGAAPALAALVLLAGALASCRSPLGPAGGAGVAPQQSLFELVAPPSPLEAVEMATNPHDPDDRQKGILLLANAPFGGESVYVEMYRLALDDGDAAVRTAALRAIGLHGTPEDGETMARLLAEDGDRLVRWEAARSLQRIHAPVAVPALIDATRPEEEPEVQVRAAAAMALGQHAEPQVLDALVAALDDRDLVVNAAARRSLRILTGETFGYDPAEWLAWLQRNEAEPFAGRREYRYPAFERDRRWFEYFNPFMVVPNEVSTRPVGLPAPSGPTAQAKTDAE